MRGRLRRLEKRAGLDGSVLEEARNLIAVEAIKRVSDEDLHAMAEIIERMPDHEAEEAVVALREECAEVWDRYEAIWREVAEEMARGR